MIIVQIELYLPLKYTFKVHVYNEYNINVIIM